MTTSHLKGPQTQKTTAAYKEGGKPFTKANEATFRPAKDYVVLKLYLRSLLLYYFFFKVRSNDTRRNGPVNLKAIPLNSCLRKQISSVVF